MEFEKKRIQLLVFVVGVIALSITADKFRQLVGKEASSKSGKFTIFDCFDGGLGTVACAGKEGVKMYINNIRVAHVEGARHKAIEKALVDALSQGLSAIDVAKQAQKEGAKAAKLATRKAKRIIGPIVSGGWDFFETMYYGGTMTEGFLRGTGTLFGTYFVGYLGEQRFGKFGYLAGSLMGSWIGGRIGIMAYDVFIGVDYLLHFAQTGESYESDQTTSYETSLESSEVDEAKVNEAPASESGEASPESYFYEGSSYTSSEASAEDSNAYEL